MSDYKLNCPLCGGEVTVFNNNNTKAYCTSCQAVFPCIVEKINGKISYNIRKRDPQNDNILIKNAIDLIETAYLNNNYWGMRNFTDFIFSIDNNNIYGHLYKGIIAHDSNDTNSIEEAVKHFELAYINANYQEKDKILSDIISFIRNNPNNKIIKIRGKYFEYFEQLANQINVSFKFESDTIKPDFEKLILDIAMRAMVANNISNER